MSEKITFEMLQEAFQNNIKDHINRPVYTARQWDDYPKERQVYMAAYLDKGTVKQIKDAGDHELVRAMADVDNINWLNRFEVIYTLDDDGTAVPIIFKNSKKHPPRVNALFRRIRENTLLVRIEDLGQENPKKERPGIGIPHRLREEYSQHRKFYNPHEVDPDLYAFQLFLNFFGIVFANDLLATTIPMFESNFKRLQDSLVDNRCFNAYRLLVTHSNAFSLEKREPGLHEQEMLLHHPAIPKMYTDDRFLDLLKLVDRIPSGYSKADQLKDDCLSVQDLETYAYSEGRLPELGSSDQIAFSKLHGRQFMKEIIDVIETKPEIRRRLVGFKYLKQVLKNMEII